MDDEAFRVVNGLLFVVVGVMLWRQLYWQIKIGLDDQQRRSAFYVVLSFSVCLIQVGLAALRVLPSLTPGPRGSFTVLILLGTTIYWVISTEKHNRDMLKTAIEHRRFPGGSVVMPDVPEDDTHPGPT